ncbi:hypothetical protein, partial [Microvirga terrestris]|uniref:hypothetical protein n=1 Tax=Microvirga terrestris TaxID=2791024 RepID=UPI001AED2E14
SSPVARQAHNLKVTGSNPVPATKPHHRKTTKPPHVINFVQVRENSYAGSGHLPDRVEVSIE